MIGGTLIKLHLDNSIEHSTEFFLFVFLIINLSDMNEASTAEALVAPDPDRDRVSNAVRSLLQSRGILQVEWAKTVAEILGVSVPQAYKYLNGRKEMAISELRVISNHFEVPIDSLLPLTRDFHRDQTILAKLKLQHDSLNCKITLGAQISWTDKVQWLAHQDNQQWIVTDAASAPKDRDVYFVEQILVTADFSRAISVAVLDDSPDAAFAICAQLSSAGFRAVPFFNGKVLIDELRSQQFDCYVLDWVLRADTSEPVAQAIRGIQGPSVPIFLLTGQWNTGRADQAEIKRAVINYGLFPRLKPISMDLLVTEIYRETKTGAAQA